MIQLSKCKNVQEDDDNSKGQGEVKKFEDGPLVQSVVSRVSMVMGLKQSLSYGKYSLTAAIAATKINKHSEIQKNITLQTTVRIIKHFYFSKNIVDRVINLRLYCVEYYG